MPNVPTVQVTTLHTRGTAQCGNNSAQSLRSNLSVVSPLVKPNRLLHSRPHYRLVTKLIHQQQHAPLNAPSSLLTVHPKPCTHGWGQKRHQLKWMHCPFQLLTHQATLFVVLPVVFRLTHHQLVQPVSQNHQSHLNLAPHKKHQEKQLRRQKHLNLFSLKMQMLQKTKSHQLLQQHQTKTPRPSWEWPESPRKRKRTLSQTDSLHSPTVWMF